ncbi:MAG TPA: AI-2E family transporter [Bacteroidales bacterium]|nr:AI-2E family transporter [Bacteroidales bacterium]
MTVKLPLYAKLVTILLGIVLVVFVMKVAKSVLVPLLISGLLAVAISPLAGWFEKRKLPRVLSDILSVLLLLAFLGALGYVMYNQVVGLAGEVGIIEQRILQIMEDINQFIERYIEGVLPIQPGNIQESIANYFSVNMAAITEGAIATITSLTMLLIFPVYIFLFLYFRRFLLQFVLMVFKEQYRPTVSEVVEKVKGVVRNYIVGMFIVIIILSILNSITLYSLGIRHALFFALFAALLNVIPYVGPFIGATLPITFALLTKDSLWYPVGVFLAFYIIQNIEGNFLTPKIVGSKVSMNPFMTIVALFVGNFIWGLAGMILFIPGMAILKVIFDVIPGMEPYGFLLGTNKIALKPKNKPVIKDANASRVGNSFIQRFLTYLTSLFVRIFSFKITNSKNHP